VTTDGKVLGFVRSHTGNCGDADSVQTYTSAWFYIPWLAEQINAVNTVSKKDLTVDAAGTHTVTWTIPVQSLKVDDVTFNPQIVDTTGLFTSDDLANCEGTFSTGESCEIKVTFNAAGSTVSSNASATLKLNDALSIPLSYTISSSGGDDGSSGGSDDSSGDSSNDSSSSSGGGSANWLVMLGLAGLLLRRKHV